jgi:PIN domain nuclease of toxin-antitoxin system
MEVAPPAVVADTSTVVWYLTDPDALSGSAADALTAATAADAPILVADVSLLELVYLVEKAGNAISATSRDEIFAALEQADGPFDVVPLTSEIARAVAAVNRDHVSDPFDRVIVATARVTGVKLVTKDRTLRRRFPDLCIW